PFDNERDGLVAYVAQQLEAFRSVAYGLTDDQARATPTPSTLSVGALVKHAAGTSRGWVERLKAAPAAPAKDDRPFEERMAAYADDFVMREDETLNDVLVRFDQQAEETLGVLREADPDTPVPVPHDAPWFPQDLENWSVRWVALHLVEELARHAGHADIIREAVDGATMYELVGGREGWPETDWLKPWRPPTRT
ncbi:MAG: DinB family protein, partial [Nocardioides sp.]